MPYHKKWVLPALLGMLVSTAALADTSVPEPALRQSMDDAWWTGPLLASSAATLPKGHVLIEPYFYDFHTVGHFDKNGKRRHTPHNDSFGSQSYLLYGVTDDFTAGLIPRFGYRRLHDGTSSTDLQVGDLTLQAQYLLNRYKPGHWAPTVSLLIQESIPIGRHDKLDDRPNDGFGSGVYTTTIGLNSQTYFWMPNGRILRTRLNLAYTLPAKGSVKSVSVYGTPEGFRGRVRSGSAFTADLGLEYSVSRRWVLALDLAYEHNDSTHVAGIIESTGSPLRFRSGSSDAFVLAPAIEYNFSSQLGVIAGVRAVVAGRNTTATVAPVIAINYVL